MKLIAITLLAASTVSGCATVVRGTTDELQIITTPDQANVTLTSGQTCVSPCTITLPRKAEFDVKVAKDGYHPASVHVAPVFAGGGGAALAGNVLIGGIIGVGVDAASGATLDLMPNPVLVTLAAQ